MRRFMLATFLVSFTSSLVEGLKTSLIGGLLAKIFALYVKFRLK